MAISGWLTSLLEWAKPFVEAHKLHAEHEALKAQRDAALAQREAAVAELHLIEKQLEHLAEKQREEKVRERKSTIRVASWEEIGKVDPRRRLGVLLALPMGKIKKHPRAFATGAVVAAGVVAGLGVSSLVLRTVVASHSTTVVDRTAPVSQPDTTARRVDATDINDCAAKSTDNDSATINIASDSLKRWFKLEFLRFDALRSHGRLVGSIADTLAGYLRDEFVGFKPANIPALVRCLPPTQTIGGLQVPGILIALSPERGEQPEGS